MRDFREKGAGMRDQDSCLERPGNFTGPKANNFQIQFIYQKLLNSSTVRSSFTGQFCFVNCIIFKIIETLILNANTANIKQFFGPEKLRDFRETGPRKSVIVCCKVPDRNRFVPVTRQK